MKCLRCGGPIGKKRKAKFCSASCRALFSLLSPPKYFTEKDIADFKYLYENFPKEKILKRFPKMQWRRIQNIAYGLGIKLTEESQLKRYADLRNGDLSKLLYMSKETCYWLGLIVTDGYISKDGLLTVALCKNDFKYLSKLAKYLDTDLSFYKPYKNSRGALPGSKGIVRIKISDKINGIKLRNLFEIKNKKTYEPVSIDFLKNKYQIFCFFIGMMDGDGSINAKGKWLNIDMHVNYYYFLQELGNKLKYFGFISNFNMSKYKSMCRFQINRTADLIKIKKMLTKLKLPILKRKWNLLNINKLNRVKKYFLPDLKSTIKKLRKKKYILRDICSLINYSSIGSLYSFCKRNYI